MPDPNQQNSKATIGVEVPEEWIDAALDDWNARQGKPTASGVALSDRSRIHVHLAAALPHIEQAIRNEEREKVLGALREAACGYCNGDTGYWVQSGRMVDGKPVEKRTWVTCQVCQRGPEKACSNPRCGESFPGKVTLKHDGADIWTAPCPDCQPPDSLDKGGEAK